LSWKNIKYKFWSIDQNSIIWQVPQSFLGELLLRITNIYDPDDYFQTDIPLVIIDGGVEFININSIKMFFSNTGIGSNNPLADYTEGFQWLSDNGRILGTVFSDGLLWAGKMNNSIIANGSQWRSGLNKGPYSPSSNGFASTHIWKIRSEIQSIEDADFKNRLVYDFEHWPFDLGAPWEDSNGDGFYSNYIDRPKHLGDETIWFVMNDLQAETPGALFGSDPIGLEIQSTIFAFNSTDYLKDVIFKKYLIINKGVNTVEDMYLSYWSDFDLGKPHNDYAGCDTSLKLGFGYNSDDSEPSQAIGYQLLHGAISRGRENDFAVMNGKIKEAYKSLSFSSFAVTVKYWEDGVTYPYFQQKEGAYHTYNNLRCLSTYNGDSLIDPVNGSVTRFLLSGDPVKGTGWYEGDGWVGGPRPGDRTMYINSGPFTFAPGDTQEIVVAIIAARGQNHLDSVTKLKEKAIRVDAFYKNELQNKIESLPYILIPESFILGQNYPNPFNPSTTINYEIGAAENLAAAVEPVQVKLIVYDVLGRKVETLVNKTQPAGKYKVTFDASNLASGVYYYRLKTKEFEQTRKMLLLR
jgi:Secretion system C-terminal sorting domain